MRIYEASQRESERHQLEKKKKAAKTYWGWLGLQGLWWWSVLKPAKISKNGGPPFSPPKASKPLREPPSSPVCPSSSLSEPPTIVDPADFMLTGLSKVGTSRSKTPETEGTRKILGVAPSFFPKNGDF